MTNRLRNNRGQFISNGNGSTKTNVRLQESLAIQELIGNALTSRSQLVDQFLDPRRDIDDECGYPSSGRIDIDSYKLLYDREAVATRAVEVLPKESWQVTPTVFEDDDNDDETDFEEAWKQLSNELRGKGWHEQEKGNAIWEYLLRSDILSGIGSFGVLLLGVDDGRDLREPADGIDDRGQIVRSNRETKLLFLRTFDESLVNITQYEGDITNPRFGQPNVYQITFNDPNDQNRSGIGIPLATMDVHWSRVIHVADNLRSSEIFGIPRMFPIFNRLYDLRKLYSGSAEMYWRGAFPGLSIETHPQLGPNVPVDAGATRSVMEQYMNGLQRYLQLSGMSAKSLAPQVVDPTPQIDVQIEAICIRLGIPKRIFTGSERGELASSQDDSTWNDRLRDRQNTYLTPRIIVPFVDRLIALGILPEPVSYNVVWPDLDALTATEQATVASLRTEAIAKYVQGGVENLIAPIDFFVRVLGMTQEEADAIVETAMEAIEEEKLTIPDEPEELFSQEDGGEFGGKSKEKQSFGKKK